MKGSVEYDGENILFEVSYGNRKTMEIAVHPDGRVTVKAPTETTRDTIYARVAKRARWIKKKLEYFRQFEPSVPKRYVGGETHLFLGRQYRLKLVNSADREVKLKGGYFFVTTPEPHDPTTIRKMLDKWYSDHALSVFQNRLQLCFESVKKLNVPFPKIGLRRLRKRWGSCGDSGYILLNTELIKTPLYCIDYVITHELCHLKIALHNKNYYRLLNKYMPDWEKRKEHLEKVGFFPNPIGKAQTGIR